RSDAARPHRYFHYANLYPRGRGAAQEPGARSASAGGEVTTSLRANGSRECAPDDRLREAIQNRARTLDCFVAPLLAMTINFKPYPEEHAPACVSKDEGNRSTNARGNARAR